MKASIEYNQDIDIILPSSNVPTFLIKFRFMGLINSKYSTGRTSSGHRLEGNTPPKEKVIGRSSAQP